MQDLQWPVLLCAVPPPGSWVWLCPATAATCVCSPSTATGAAQRALTGHHRAWRCRRRFAAVALGGGIARPGDGQ
eukprot:11221874-Lingulodinium_polyedra.AAC.1